MIGPAQRFDDVVNQLSFEYQQKNDKNVLKLFEKLEAQFQPQSG